MNSSKLVHAQAAEDENARMRRIIANLTLENDAMKQLIEDTPGAVSAKSRD